jgi:hypothetical membrane protein
MNSSWIFIGTGIAFCLAGIYLFQKSVFEEHKKIGAPLLVIVAGIILVAIGTWRALQ